MRLSSGNFLLLEILFFGGCLIFVQPITLAADFANNPSDISSTTGRPSLKEEEVYGLRIRDMLIPCHKWQRLKVFLPVTQPKISLKHSQSSRGGLLLKKVTDLRKKPEKAVPQLDRYLDEYPKDSQYYTFRAMIWMRHGMLHKALPDCEKALRFNPDDGVSRMNRMFAIQGLLRNLQNKDALVRLVAAQGLGGAVTSAVELSKLTNALKRAQQDSDPQVRQAAKYSLKKIQKAAQARPRGK